MTTKLIAVLVGGSCLTAIQIASAQEYVETGDTDVYVEEPGPYSYAWYEPRMASVIGVGVTLGGGINGFTDSQVSDNLESDIGGVWQIRATIGTHIPIGLDLSYTGSSVDLEPFGIEGTGELLGTNLEAAVRWNILPHYSVNPYIFGGAGWQMYDIRDTTFALSDAGIDDDESIAVFPMGAGVAYRDISGITFDARGTFRLAADSSLIADANGEFADLHTWEASGNVGYEF
jgi:hypothetical protein